MRWTVEEEEELAKIYFKIRPILVKNASKERKQWEGVNFQDLFTNRKYKDHDFNAFKMRLSNFAGQDKELHKLGFKSFLSSSSKQTRELFKKYNQVK